jgi:hypothetical protein
MSGETAQTGKTEAGAIGGYGGAVLVVVWSGDRLTSLGASIFDIKERREAGKVMASASGKPWAFAVIPSPLILGAPAFTEWTACGDLGEAVAKFFAGESPLKLSKNLRFSDLAEISRGLITRTELQEHFGSPQASHTTSVERKTETYPIEETEVTFVYGEDDRVLYYYNTKADPPERYSQALGPMTHPLDHMEEANCPKLKVCVESYIEEARKRAEEVGYELTAQDQEAFRKDLEIAVRVDDGEIVGEIITEEVFREELTSGCRDQRRAPLSRDHYDFINKLTDRLLNEVAEGSATITDAVTRYIQQLAARFDYRLTCTDKETFQSELEIAKDVDDGKVTRDEAYDRLQGVTTRHLIRLYYGRL